MELNELKQFILEASHNTYASGNEKIREKEEDGSTSVTYSKGGWEYHDNYFGGEPYGGREVVFFKKRPVWMMVYYGWITEGVDPDRVYPILGKALCNSSVEKPYRGPDEFIEDESIYANDMEGDVENFRGEERIYDGEELLYIARYMGGLVDRE
ncbi:MAG: DUF5680 domain-containing protein [Candidatus Dojkabacteria bacterium]|jgi:hypothetical protein|nr:DUF5680 domain-containing protein [Candidatus Dojkabacteria bacterium]